MNVRLTAEAEADLERIADTIARDNPPRALTFVQELRAACLGLADFPSASLWSRATPITACATTSTATTWCSIGWRSTTSPCCMCCTGRWTMRRWCFGRAGRTGGAMASLVHVSNASLLPRHLANAGTVLGTSSGTWSKPNSSSQISRQLGDANSRSRISRQMPSKPGNSEPYVMPINSNSRMIWGLLSTGKSHTVR